MEIVITPPINIWKNSRLSCIVGVVGSVVAVLLSASPVLAANPTSPCEVDINQDKIVDVTDYSILVSDKNYLATPIQNPRADLNKDNVVDVTDYSILVSFFFQTCGGTTGAKPSYTASSTDVIIDAPNNSEPNDYLYNILNNKQGSAVYVLKPGIYRIARALPLEAGDTLIGEKGAIISGARLLDSSKAKFESSSGLYYFEGQTQYSDPEPFPGDYMNISGTASNPNHGCQSDRPHCNRNEELFVNDVVLKWALNKGEVKREDQWFFDYGSDRIYMKQNPAGKKVETSVTDYMIRYNEKPNIRIANLIVEKFATPAQQSAVEVYGENGIIEFSEFRWIHGTAAGVGINGKFRHNYLHHNGQKAISSFVKSSEKKFTKNALYEYNEIAFNNTAGFNYSWEAGGNKWALSDGIVARGNYAHDNIGPGLWMDIDNINCLFEDNILVRNRKMGLQIEISFNCEVRNNFIGYNQEYQMFVDNSGSRDANKPFKVHNNTIVVDGAGKLGIGVQIEPHIKSDQPLTAGSNWSYIHPLGSCNNTSTLTRSQTCWPYEIKNVEITDNKVYFGYNGNTDRDKGVIGGLFGRGRSDLFVDPFNFESARNGVTFKNNTYYINDPNRKVWSWGPYWTYKNYNEFKALTGETKDVVTNFSLPPVPAWNYAKGPQNLR